MTSNEVREKYLKFFKGSPRNHVEIQSSPLVLENDLTTLFTSSGMQQLISYLKGEPHPKGRRLVDCQPSIRLQDIEEVGDKSHTTFFEMLGNWSLGDYFKKEQLRWIFDFLTDKNEGLGLKAERFYVSVFGGDEGFSVDGKLNQLAPDIESMSIWTELFREKGIEAKVANLGNQTPDITKGRIFYYGVDKNWWSRIGTPAQMPVGEIGGPDSEIFYDFGEELKLHMKSPWKSSPCHPNCSCGRFLEIGNSVFIQYKKVGERALEELPNKNVDFGGGLERITAVVNGDPDVFKIDIFAPIIQKIEELTGNSYVNEERSMRVIADHLRAAVRIVSEGISPSNKRHGYILRRLIRRACDQIRGKLVSEGDNYKTYSVPSDLRIAVVRAIVDKLTGGDLKEKAPVISKVIEEEVNSYERLTTTTTLPPEKNISGKEAFQLHSTHGFSPEQLRMRGYVFDEEEYNQEFKKHQELSRTASAGMFKGGLTEQSEEATKLHTATHLLHAALRKVLGEHVSQKGSNITAERLRFDFSHSQKLPDEEVKNVEDLINKQIVKDLPVSFEIKTLDEAIAEGALHFFAEKYGEKVKVYTIGDSSAGSEPPFSREVCGGPHVTHTGEIGSVKIIKQEKIGSGLIRIYATIK